MTAGRGDKSYPNAYMNSVFTTKFLLEALAESRTVRRVVCISSFSVFSTEYLRASDIIDETCRLEKEPHLRGEAYCYAKVRQEELFQECAQRFAFPT